MKTLSLLVKPVSSSCNMRCGYCFYADVSDNRGVKNCGIMKDKLLETVVKKALSEARKLCVYGFQGGEPTLAGLGFFSKFVEYVKKYNINGTRVIYTLQTNGLALDKEWAEFFRGNKFLIGLSIDATSQVHDEFRRDAAGIGTHVRCVKVARLLAEHNVDFNILSVVTKQFAAHPGRVWNFYKKHNFKYVQFIPCLDNYGDQPGLNGYSLTAKSFGNFLCAVFDLWYTDFMKGDYVSVRVFDNYIQMLMGHPPENCAMNGVCNAYALIEADGSVYPCDFYAMDGYLLGNVETHGFEEMLTGEKAEAFIKPSARADPACRTCEYGFICRGGCRRDREPFTDDLPGLNRYCGAYKAFFSYALPRMTEIARRLAGK